MEKNEFDENTKFKRLLIEKAIFQCKECNHFRGALLPDSVNMCNYNNLMRHVECIDPIPEWCPLSNWKN